MTDWGKWLDPDHLRLHAGEMTAQELRTVQAVVRAMLAEREPSVSTVSTTQNQCDGCMQGAELRGNLHVDRYGKAFMVCERDRYASGVEAVDWGCPTCHGNDTDMPCAYPEGGQPGCLRDKRLGRTAGVSASEVPSTEPKCNPHPDAPHGFNRNASHNAGRYVCDCEGWEHDGVAMPSAPADPIMDVVEQIAQQWDGCTHEASGIEIGEAIRSAGIRLTLGVMVDAPTLPPLPEPGDTDGCTYAAYTDEQMREYALAALAAYGVALRDAGQQEGGQC